MRQISGAPRPDLSPRSRASLLQQRVGRERRLWPHIRHVEPLRLRQIPLLVAALCFAIGIAIPKLTPPVTRPALFLLIGCATLFAFAAFALVRARRIAWFAVTALWIAIGIWCAQMEPGAAPQAALLAYADGLSRTMDARVVRIRELPSRTSDATRDLDRDRDFDGEEEDPATTTGITYSLDLAVSAIEEVTPDTSRMVPVSGNIRATLISLPGQVIAPHLRCGDQIEVPVRLRAPQRFRDPGVFQYADYLLTEDAGGLTATSSVAAARIKLLPPTTRMSAAASRCRILAAQTWAANRMISYIGSTANHALPAALRLSAEDAATLNAMLFGDRARLTHTLRLGFERTGSFHIFVVSGMHVALLALMIFWITRRLRLPRWLATMLTLLASTGYAALTGFGVPVRRALLMTAVYFIARLLFRERIHLNALGAAALAVLVWSPRSLFETSFQMTFLALVAIAGIAAPLAERRLVPWSYAASRLDQRWKDTTVPPRLAQLRVMLRLWGGALADVFGTGMRRIPEYGLRAVLWLAELALVGLVAEAVMVLPMAEYFHRATVFALPLNLLSIPLVGLIVPLGLATFVLALASPWLALLPAPFTALLLHGVMHTIRAAALARGADLRIPGPTLARALAALACIGFCCWTVRRRRGWLLSAATLLPAAALLVLWPAKPLKYQGSLEVTAIDVGQGDSLLVVGPEGQTMLVDAGGPTGAAAHAENATGTAAFDVGEQVVSPYLWWRGFRSLDVVVLSHAHSDHMGGMPAVLANFHPRELWVGIDPGSEAYRDLLRRAAALGTRVRHLNATDALTFDATQVQVLAPAVGYTNSGSPKNNDSLVLRMQFGKASVLLEGDAEAPSEHAFSAAGLPPVTLLKVAHHGSRTSTTPELLAWAAPRDALISDGRGNTFGHPRPEILARLQAAHARVFRTDEFGLTTFLLSRDGNITSLAEASHP